MNFKYLVVGGGIAGTTAAETIRTKDLDGTIAIVNAEPYPLYSRVMLSKPNFVLEKIKEENIWLKTREWYSENKIELIAGENAVDLDVSEKIIYLAGGRRLGYEKLLLAVGSRPRPWQVKGAEKNGVFCLRNLNDVRAIKKALKRAKTGAAVGGGFISFEICEIMRLLNCEANLIIREAHYWEPILDKVSGQIIERAMEKNGVRIWRNSEVETVVGEDKVEGVILKNGQKIPCQMIVAGIGVDCPFDWFKQAGVAVSRGILANEYLETNVPDVWTAGDAAEFNDLVLGETVQLGNWTNAQKQGEIAGLNMAGEKKKFRLVSSYCTDGFGLKIAFIGDVRPAEGRETIDRGLPGSDAYGRIIIKDDEIVGATLINRSDEISALSKIIEKDVKITGEEKKLSDPDFNLEVLIPKC